MADAATPNTVRDPESGRFLPGNTGGGRPRGSRNKLGEAFLADLYEHWKANGVSALERCLASKPEVYVRVVASLMPQQIEVKEAAFDGITDEQLTALIAAARATVTVRGADGAGASATAH